MERVRRRSLPPVVVNGPTRRCGQNPPKFCSRLARVDSHQSTGLHAGRIPDLRVRKHIQVHSGRNECRRADVELPIFPQVLRIAGRSACLPGWLPSIPQRINPLHSRPRFLNQAPNEQKCLLFPEHMRRSSSRSSQATLAAMDRRFPPVLRNV